MDSGELMRSVAHCGLVCGLGLYAPECSPKVKAFAAFIRQEGMAAFIAGVQAGRARGLDIEKGGDYDGRPREEVWRLLKD